MKITIKIDGMACSMCEAHINDAIRNAFSVKKIRSSHKKGETTLITETDIPEDALKSVIEKTGYKVITIDKTADEGPSRKFGFFHHE